MGCAIKRVGIVIIVGMCYKRLCHGGKGSPSNSPQTIDEFLVKYEAALEEFRTSGLYYGDDDPHHYATFAYDAVWTMALALHRASQVLE